MTAGRFVRGMAVVLLVTPLLAVAQEVPGQKAPKPIQKPAPAPVEKTAPAHPAPPNSPLKVTVQQFDFTGNSVFDSATLSKQVESYLGHPITIAEIYEAADKVAQIYVEKGYTLASVSPPAQKIANGHVRLEVIEGKVGKVGVEGNTVYSSEQVQKTLGAFDKGQVYRGDTLEEGMFRVNDLPGENARAVLKPGAEYGTTDIVIKADEKRVGGALTFDNYGRKDIGTFRTTGSVVINNPTTLRDQLQLSYTQSAGALLKYGYADYNVAVGYSGLRADVSYGEARYQPELAGTGISIHGKNRTGTAQLEYPVLRTRTDTFSVSGGAQRILADSSFAGISIPGVSITIGQIGGFYNHVYANSAVTQSSLTLASSFSSPDRSDFNVQDETLRAELDLQHLQPIVSRLDGYARVNGVWSPDRLPKVSQFSIGGATSVRGYPPSELTGDRGYFGTAGLRYSIPIGTFRTAARIFVDTGGVQHLEHIVRGESFPHETSAGVGFDASVPTGPVALTAKIDLSMPTDDPESVSDDKHDGRVYAALTASF